MRLALLVLVLAAPPAAAEPELPLAVGVNCPCWWDHATSVAGTLLVGLTERDAVRVNVATYTAHESGIAGVVDGIYGDGGSTYYDGRIWDVGFSWIHYSRKLWDGFTYEVGINRRARNVYAEDEETRQATWTDSTTYAARAQIGWSWLLGHHVFIAAAVGLSMGVERGKQTLNPDLDAPQMLTTSDLSRADVGAEGYLRFGIAR